MNKKWVKRDRTARLLRLQLLLWQNPDGLKVDDIAHLCSVNVRTVYRDLLALETELNVPIWQEGKKRGIAEGYFLPPIAFTMTDAMSIFLAIRLLYNYIHRYNPNLISTFIQLASIVPQPLRKQVQNTIERIEKLPRNEKRLNIFNKLTHGWLTRHPVKFLYQELSNKVPEKREVYPYAIEPGVEGHSNYIIGYAPEKKAILTFRIDCIIGDVMVDESTTFEIPGDFDINDYLSSAWGAYADARIETVKLRFSPAVSRAIGETTWHPSQKIDLQSDGSLLMTLNVQNTLDFRAWIMGKGADVEVIEPQSLRDQIIQTTRMMMGLYTH
jgi:predicted DNA-binding transcriptional regulator YafY